MDLAIVYSILVPNFKGSGCFYDNSFIWKDSRPQPTEEECEATWKKYADEEARKENNKNAYKTYEAALNSGYLHTDGIIYHCSETATLDYVKLVTLLDIELKEPVILRTFNGIIIELSYTDFKLMAVEVGKYQYALRLKLWSNLR